MEGNSNQDQKDDLFIMRKWPAPPKDSTNGLFQPSKTYKVAPLKIKNAEPPVLAIETRSLTKSAGSPSSATPTSPVSASSPGGSPKTTSATRGNTTARLSPMLRGLTQESSSTPTSPANLMVEGERINKSSTVSPPNHDPLQVTADPTLLERLNEFQNLQRKYNTLLTKLNKLITKYTKYSYSSLPSVHGSLRSSDGAAEETDLKLSNLTTELQSLVDLFSSGNPLLLEEEEQSPTRAYTSPVIQRASRSQPAALFLGSSQASEPLVNNSSSMMDSEMFSPITSNNSTPREYQRRTLVRNAQLAEDRPRASSTTPSLQRAATTGFAKDSKQRIRRSNSELSRPVDEKTDDGAPLATDRPMESAKESVRIKRTSSFLGEGSSAEWTQILSLIPRQVVRYYSSVTAPRSQLRPSKQGITERFVAPLLYVSIAGINQSFDASTAQQAQIQGLPLSKFLEEVTKVLNGFFSVLMEIVTLHGGDVVQYSPDGFYAVFRPNPQTTNVTEEDFKQCNYLAVQCALMIQEKALAFMSDNVKFFKKKKIPAFGVQIAVGYGKLFGLHIGEHNELQFVLIGSPVLQVHECIQQAQPGEILVPYSFWAKVKKRFFGDSLEKASRVVRVKGVSRAPVPLPSSPNQSIKIDRSSRDILLNYMPRCFKVRIRNGIFSWNCEASNLTCVSIFIPGIDCDVQEDNSGNAETSSDEEDSQEALTTPKETQAQDESKNQKVQDLFSKLNSILQHVQRVLQKFEGTLLRFSLDDKGCFMVAAFGIPPLTHEDDGYRGVEFGLQVHNSLLSHMKLRCSIGITTGQVLCGPIGSTQRSIPAVIGDISNLSLRLMDSASGEIWCDETTYRVTTDRIRYEELPPLVVKVKGQIQIQSSKTSQISTSANTTITVPVYHPLNTALNNPMYFQLRSLFGRDKEIALMEEILQAQKSLSISGHPIILIEGARGIGKSLLVFHFMMRAQYADCDVFHSSCGNQDQFTPYYAWIPIMRSLFKLDEISANPAERLEQQRNHILKFLDNVQQESSLTLEVQLTSLAPLLEPIFRVGFQEEDTKKWKGEKRVEKTNYLLYNILKCYTSTHPSVVVIQDIHWIDPSSLKFLKYMESQPLSELVIVLNRTPLSASYDFPLAEHELYGYLVSKDLTECTKLHLQPLEETAVTDLACDRLALSLANFPVETTQFIKNASNGNPLYIEQLLLHMKDNQMMDDTGKITLHSASLESFSNQPLSRIVLHRFHSLEDAAKMALQVASVACVGSLTFNSAMLENVMTNLASQNQSPFSVNSELVSNVLTQLVKVDLLKIERIEAERIYMMHAEIQDIIYSSMPVQARQKIHVALLAYWDKIEKDKGKHKPHTLAVLAFHAASSQTNPNFKRAIRNLKQIAEYALLCAASIEATQRLETAWSCAKLLSDSTEEREKTELQLLLQLGTPLREVRGVNATEPVFKRLKELVPKQRTEMDLTKFDYADIVFTLALHKGLNEGKQKELIAMSYELTEFVENTRHGSEWLKLQSHHVKWIALLQNGSFYQVMEHAEEGLDNYYHHMANLKTDMERMEMYHSYPIASVKDAHIFHHVAASAHLHNCIACLFIGKHEQALEQYQKLTALINTTTSTSPISIAVCCASIYVLLFPFMDHRVEEVRDMVMLFKDFLLSAVDCHLDEFTLIVNAYLYWVEFETGNKQESVELAKQLLKTPTFTRMKYMKTLAALPLISILLEGGKIAEALQAINDEIKDALEVGTSMFQAELLRLKAKAMMMQKSDEVQAKFAEDLLKESIELATKQSGRQFVLRSSTLLYKIRKQFNFPQLDVFKKQFAGLVSQMPDNGQNYDLIAAKASLV